MIWNLIDDLKIADSDPLSADEIMSEVPLLNEKEDVKGLTNLLKELCNRAKIKAFTYYEIAAMVRDIGFLVGSIRKHNCDPIKLVPPLESLLEEAGKLTDLPPRDTLMHYTIWNPQNSRLRKYTLHDQEPHLIESIRISLPAIRSATRDLFYLQMCDLNDCHAEKVSEQIIHSLELFLSGLSHSIHCVKPDVFIKYFRPFFEPITIKNVEFRGPGAVTMPLHIFDFILWGSSETNQRYQLFTSDYIPYNTPEFRQYYLLKRNNKSFLDRLEEETVSINLIHNVELWFKKIAGFRHSHFKYANVAYNGNTYHNFKTGSGGHSICDLEILSNLTDFHHKRIRKIINDKKTILCLT